MLNTRQSSDRDIYISLRETWQLTLGETCDSQSACPRREEAENACRKPKEHQLFLLAKKPVYNREKKPHTLLKKWQHLYHYIVKVLTMALLA